MMFCRLMFISGFFFTSLLMVTFMAANGIGKRVFTCDGDFAAIDSSPFCLFQATALIFLLIWTETWSFFMALECYLYICSATDGWNRAGKYNTVYFIANLIISSTCAFIPLGVGNLGYDIYASCPFCFYMVSDTRKYLFATLVYPFISMAFGCIVLTFVTIYKIQITFVVSGTYNGNGIPEAHQNVRSEIVRIQRTTMDTKSADAAKAAAAASAAAPSPAMSPLYVDNDAVCVSIWDEPRMERMSESVRGSSLRGSVGVAFPPHVNYGFFDESDLVQQAAAARSSEALRNSNPSAASESLWNNDNAILNHSDNVDLMKSNWSKISVLARKTWQYSGQQLIFAVTFLMVTAFIIPAFFEVYYVHYDEYLDAGDKFTACLVTSSFQYSLNERGGATQEGADNYAQSSCGTHMDPRPPKELVREVFERLF